MNSEARRAFMTMVGAGALLAACRNETHAFPQPAAPGGSPSAAGRKEKGAEEEDDDDGAEAVSATEDLMREHGVIRRVLVIYRLSAVRLRTQPASVPLDSVRRAAKLMRAFGEEYHERQLEEAHLFPAVLAAGGSAAAEIQTLLAQHRRGREITEYVLTITEKPVAAAAEPLARVLDSFALMYEEHAAREDTIVFPAWKQALGPKQRHEMAELFEDIEHKTFGKDGFGEAVQEIAAIEQAWGLDPASLTPPPPSK